MLAGVEQQPVERVQGAGHAGRGERSGPDLPQQPSERDAGQPHDPDERVAGRDDRARGQRDRNPDQAELDERGDRRDGGDERDDVEPQNHLRAADRLRDVLGERDERPADRVSEHPGQRLACLLPALAEEQHDRGLAEREEDEARRGTRRR